MQVVSAQELTGPPIVDPGIASPADGAEAAPLVIVRVADLRCALPADTVIELHQMVATVQLPTPVSGVDGVIDRRGALVVVLDLRARMGLPTRPPQVTDHLVVVRLAAGPVALRVDRVEELVVSSADAVAEVGALPGEGSRHGAVRLPDGLVLIYDAESFLSPEDAAVVAAAMEELRHAPERSSR